MVQEPVPDQKADQKAVRRVAPDQSLDLAQGVGLAPQVVQEHLQDQQDHGLLPIGLRDPDPSLDRVQEAVPGQSLLLQHVRDHQQHDREVVRGLVQVLQVIPTKFRCCPKLITMTYLLT